MTAAAGEPLEKVPPSLKPGEDVVFFSGKQASPRGAFLTVGGAIAGAGLLMLRPMAGVATVLLLLGASFVTIGLILRNKACEINLKGIVIRDGRDQWGDVHFIPWKSVERFGGRKARGGLVRLYYQQRGMSSRDLLPGGTMTTTAYESLVDRIRVALGPKANQLRLGSE